MPHLTKSEIEQRLLTGMSLSWCDPNGKNQELVLSEAKARRLFAFLLASTIRTPTELSEDFVDGLYSAFSASEDPAKEIIGPADGPSNGPWRLQSIQTEGFGGLNTWAGPTFEFTFDGESLLVEGPNGSGKSSLIGAIIWALSGERPRDQSESNANHPKPVFTTVNDKPAGDWPPIACYPMTTIELNSEPYVRSCLTFKNESGQAAKVERVLDKGEVTVQVDPVFHVPSILIETGVLMPARLATIRLDDGRGRLTDAVQKLTGLDDLVSIGALVNGLCHQSREYLAYKRKEVATEKTNFEQGLAKSREILSSVEVVVPEFEPQDTKDKEGNFAKLGKTLNERAAELTKVVSKDLADGLDLANPTVQHNVISAVGAAKDDLETGLGGLAVWITIKAIADALDADKKQDVLGAIEAAQTSGDEAIQLLEKSNEDTRFQLKALASQWHEQHKTGPIENCPLCDNKLQSNPNLCQELEELRSAGDAAARTFQDNLNTILSDIEDIIPAAFKKFTIDNLAWDPKTKIDKELRDKYVESKRYSEILTVFAGIASDALASAPSCGLEPVEKSSDESKLSKLNQKILVIQRLLDLALWYADNQNQWTEWWHKIVHAKQKEETTTNSQDQPDVQEKDLPECLLEHLDRLSDALEKAEPYRTAAAAMRKSWAAGLIAAEIETELKRRQAVADQLSPLKSLGLFAEAIARETIDGLSDRIANHLKNTLLTEQFRFQSTRLKRKEGLVVRGGFVDEFQIDASLVANTSWIRALLWAFLFALREEAIEQQGDDQFPLMVFDDPQLTFDFAHRHRWAQCVTSLQNSVSQTQVVLTTYDEMFLDLIKISGMTGREAMIAAPSTELPHAGIFEGEFLDRTWAEAESTNTNKAGREYIVKVRQYVEGLLRLMLRGEEAAVLSVVVGFVIGESRDKLRYLHQKGLAPWDRPEFKKLVGSLGKELTPIEHMEISHHSGGSLLGMAEAHDVEEHWRKKLGPALARAFGLARQHHLLHGGLTALHAPPPTVALPNGYKSKVKAIPLRVHGRAAALSSGRVADGLVDVSNYDSSKYQKIVLAQHLAFRLTARTLEPVARHGDILLVKEVGEPTPKSLVVAIGDDRILARRLEIAANHSDVAVLTAQSINPRHIAPPEIAHKATFKLYKIVGVIYDEDAWDAPAQSGMEVSVCGGEDVLNKIAADTFGLIEVEGQSAEPYALHGQCLIVRNEILADQDLAKLDGRPVIAADSNDNRYFKRLQLLEGDRIVLESLDSGGDFGPVVLSSPGCGPNCLTRVWPVAGVLFELPN